VLIVTGKHFISAEVINNNKTVPFTKERWISKKCYWHESSLNVTVVVKQQGIAIHIQFGKTK